MTISNTQVEESWAGDNSTLVFDIPFPFLTRSHLRAVRRSPSGEEAEVEIVSSTGGNGAPGTATLAEVVGSGNTLVIYRETSPTQDTDYTPHDPFPANSHERALDKATMLLQELQHQTRAGGRFLQFPRAERDYSGVLPTATDRAGLVLGFDDESNLSLFSPNMPSAYSVRSHSFDALDGQTTFFIPNGYDVSFIHVWLNGVKLRLGEEFTATNGETIVLASAAAGGDEVQVLKFGAFAADGSVRLTGDEMTGPLYVPELFLDGDPLSALLGEKADLVGGKVPPLQLPDIGDRRTIVSYGGVGDNSTINDDALADAVASGDAFIPDGKFRISTEIPTNTRGVPVSGPGSIMVPVDQTQPSKGYHRYPFTEDEGKSCFGLEYLFPLHYVWFGAPGVGVPKIYLAGDSTIYGAYITNGLYLPHNALLTGLRRRGFEATVSNQAVSGATTLDFNSQMSDAEIDDAKCIIISYGINDSYGSGSWTTLVNGSPVTSYPVHASLDAWIAAYRAVLLRIRTRRSELDCAIVIKTSSAVSDSQHWRDETQAWEQRKALRKLAREFKCAFFDTPAYIADVRQNQLIDGLGTIGPTGKWSGATLLQEGWMDDPFRTDPVYADPNAYNCAVHPLDLANGWIWGEIAAFLVGPGAALWSANSWANNPQSIATAGQLPDSFGVGATTYRAQVSDGWPIEGIVYTMRDPAGAAIQWNYAYNDNFPHIAYRTAVVGNAWCPWRHDWSAQVALTPLNSWTTNVGGSQPLRLVRKNGVAFLSGNVQGGTNTAGTLLCTIPTGWGSATDLYLTINGGAAGVNRGVIKIEAEHAGNSFISQVTIQTPCASADMNLDGICYPIRGEF